MRRSSAPSQVFKRKSLGELPEPRPLKQSNFSNVFANQFDARDGNELSEYELMIQKILNQPFKIPIANYTGGLYNKSLGIRRDGARRALHDPFEENALVLYSPPELTEQEKLTIDKAKQLVHVVVDPLLTKILRPHQREGVKFMYDCVTGRKIGMFDLFDLFKKYRFNFFFKYRFTEDKFGCIIADDMGADFRLQ